MDGDSLAAAVKEYQARKQMTPAPIVAATPSSPTVSDASALSSAPATSVEGLVAGLIRDFGLGNEPRLRRALYDRLARLEHQYGQAVEVLIAEVRSMAKAPTVRQPGNYFARAVTLRLREGGFV